MSRKKWCLLRDGAMHESHHQACEGNFFAMKNEKLIFARRNSLQDRPAPPNFSGMHHHANRYERPAILGLNSFAFYRIYN
jgi:hypothetical protein